MVNRKNLEANIGALLQMRVQTYAVGGSYGLTLKLLHTVKCEKLPLDNAFYGVAIAPIITEFAITQRVHATQHGTCILLLLSFRRKQFLRV